MYEFECVYAIVLGMRTEITETHAFDAPMQYSQWSITVGSQVLSHLSIVEMRVFLSKNL